MKTHIVLSSANIEITYRLAGAGSRLAAFVLDILLQGLACLGVAAGVLGLIFGYGFDRLGEVGGLALGTVIIAWFVIYFCYFIVCEMLMNGQSIGKRIFGLRVIRDNGLPVGLSQSVVRGLFRALVDVLYVGLFCILFSEKCKRIGDIAAGTVVVAAHYSEMPPGQLIAPRLSPSPENTAAVEKMTHLVLSEAEKYLLSRYLARKADFPDGGKRLENEWAAYLAQKWDIDKALIDDALLAGLMQINE